ncbi:MAG: hypothetical protein JXR96_09355 [Deltaproteobacteria bacterium]|nr:hypothetical protein [Deltaproteobacteria bacterium]
MKILLSLFVLALCPALAWAQVTVHSQPFEGMSPWSEFHPSETTADWSIESSGSNPSCSPHQGSHMVMFNSYSADSGDEARISSPALDLTGAQVAECRMWMYHDTGDSSREDRVRFQVSTDGGDSYSSTVEFVRTAGSGWVEEVAQLGYYTGRSDLRIALRGLSRYGNNIFIDDLRVIKDTLPAGAEGANCSGGTDCDSGICGQDPDGQGRCRASGTVCIDGNRRPVPQGFAGCHGPDVARCNGTDSWQLTSCYDDCEAYSDVHSCDLGSCAECKTICVDLGFIVEGCDEDAYCEGLFIGQCYRKKQNQQSCDYDGQCLSDNCVAAPGGATYCAPAGTDCVDATGAPVSRGTAVCESADLWTCGAGGWTNRDCYTNCGFYLDVDSCTGGACATCAASCNGDQDCKPGILCIDHECAGDLPNGSTCQLDDQCASSHCVDGRCCQDICTAPCHRCDIDATGVCRPVPAGQDPDGECAGQAGCAGACNGSSACAFPGQDTVCAVCTRCNGAGSCSVPVAAQTDPLDECPACQACNGSGACAAVAAGTDPLDDCSQTPVETCGLSGDCDGQGACSFWPAGSECGPGHCSDGVEEVADSCDGAGRCADGGTRSCAPYRCADALHCATACRSHADCSAQSYCSLGATCEVDLSDGARCDGVVLSGLAPEAACRGGYCFTDDFDDSGAYCASDPACCVHDGTAYGAGYALCSPEGWYRVCIGGAQAWGERVECGQGECDAGGGPDSGFRTSGGCASGPGGGCSATCTSCEPYRSNAAGCLDSCSSEAQCWDGYECREGQCDLPEGIGEPCETQADCTAGTCMDGRCCNEACTGPCRQCNLPGREGLCSYTAAGSDPDGDCEPEATASCGRTGECDGGGACALWPAGEPCAEAHCEGGVLMSASSCDGLGQCAAGSETDCRPGRCEQGACSSGCSAHADCDPSGFCGLDGLCLADLTDGSSCDSAVLSGLARDPACLGGFCLDDGWSGVGAYCAPAVDACVAEGEVYGPGEVRCSGDDWYRICVGGEYGWGPEVECEPPAVCDAGGGSASGVSAAETCRSGRPGGCGAACETCYPYRAAGPGECAAGCQDTTDCWPGHGCAGGVCTPEAGLGSPCGSAADCAAGQSCADDVCCNRICDAPCERCDLPSALGVCVYAAAGTDPRDACEPEQTPCGQTGTCAGSADCALDAQGVECSPQSCEGGVKTSAGLCDGLGDCQPGRQHVCPSGRCEQDRCAASAPDGGVPDAGFTGLSAEAGPTQRVRPGETVELDGSLSRGSETLAFFWTQSSGPEEVALSGATTSRPSFTPALEGVYVFELVVSDGQDESDPDFTEVHVTTGAGGCGCGSGSPGGLWILVLLAAGACLRAGRREVQARG